MSTMTTSMTSLASGTTMTSIATKTAPPTEVPASSTARTTVTTENNAPKGRRCLYTPLRSCMIHSLYTHENSV